MNLTLSPISGTKLFSTNYTRPFFCSAKQTENKDVFVKTKSQKQYDEIKWMCSREKDENGNLKSGLTRPLSLPEARTLNSFGVDKDINDINYYIYLMKTQQIDNYSAIDEAIFKYNDNLYSNFILINQYGLDPELSDLIVCSGQKEIIMNNIDRFLNLVNGQYNSNTISLFSRPLKTSEAALALEYNLNDKQVEKFIQYQDYENIESDEAAYEASFYFDLV